MSATLTSTAATYMYVPARVKKTRWGGGLSCKYTGGGGGCHVNILGGGLYQGRCVLPPNLFDLLLLELSTSSSSSTTTTVRECSTCTCTWLSLLPRMVYNLYHNDLWVQQ